MKREALTIYVKIYMNFFALRVKNVLSEQGIRYDVVDAVMAAGFKDWRQTVDRACCCNGCMLQALSKKISTMSWMRSIVLQTWLESGV